MRQYIYLVILPFLLYPHHVFGLEPDWSEYDQLLENYVSTQVRSGIPENWVDYSGISQAPVFKKLVQSIETFPTEQLGNRTEKLGFYINAYNILAIKMVLDHRPVSSIKDAGSWVQPVWDKPAGKINGKEVTLGIIEHEILRPMGEPRVHMAIVCASLSCPDLRREAYRAERLEDQLQDQTLHFLKNKAKGLRIENHQVYVSKIFEWFEDDFAAYGGIEAFIRQYIDIPSDVTMKPVITYNWDLNGS